MRSRVWGAGVNRVIGRVLWGGSKDLRQEKNEEGM